MTLSYKVFMSFVDDDGNASRMLSKECYETWIRTRKTKLKQPEESFRRVLTAHVCGMDGRRPFPEKVEKSLLKCLRVREVWECFKGTEVSIGVRGFRNTGYHENEELKARKIHGMGEVTTMQDSKLKRKRRAADSIEAERAQLLAQQQTVALQQQQLQAQIDQVKQLKLQLESSARFSPQQFAVYSPQGMLPPSPSGGFFVQHYDSPPTNVGYGTSSMTFAEGNAAYAASPHHNKMTDQNQNTLKINSRNGKSPNSDRVSTSHGMQQMNPYSNEEMRGKLSQINSAMHTNFNVNGTVAHPFRTQESTAAGQLVGQYQIRGVEGKLMNVLSYLTLDESGNPIVHQVQQPVEESEREVKQ